MGRSGLRSFSPFLLIAVFFNPRYSEGPSGGDYLLLDSMVLFVTKVTTITPLTTCQQATEQSYFACV